MICDRPRIRSTIGQDYITLDPAEFAQSCESLGGACKVITVHVQDAVICIKALATFARRGKRWRALRRFFAVVLPMKTEPVKCAPSDVRGSNQNVGSPLLVRLDWNGSLFHAE